MSVRVNLLPAETARRQAAARQRTGVVLGVAAVLAGLAAVTVWQNGRIDDAETRLADERTVLAALQGDVQQLSEFADLESRVSDAQGNVTQALLPESSFAGILQDVAAVIPSDIELQSLNVDVDPATAVPGAETTSIGTLVAVGYSLNDHAPGLERMLIELDKAAAFHEVFFTGSAHDEPGVPYPLFSVEAQLGPEILTGRYIDGVPENLR